MKKLFPLFLILILAITPPALSQTDADFQFIDSLIAAGEYEQARHFATDKYQQISTNAAEYSDVLRLLLAVNWSCEYWLRMNCDYSNSLSINKELEHLINQNKKFIRQDLLYFIYRNMTVNHTGLGQYDEAQKYRDLLYKAHKKGKLPCDEELCHYYNFDFFRIDTLNIWGYEWYDELPRNRFSTSFTKVVYYVYSTHPDGSDKDQLYRLHLLMFHGTDMPFDYIMTRYISTENGEMRSSMYDYTYKENIDYEKLHNDVIEIVKGGKKTDTRQNSHYKAIEDFIPDTVGISAEAVEAREKTEYVAKKPYEEYDIGYDFILSSSYNYGHLNISLNGTVKSVVQTEMPVSLLKKANSSEKVSVRQQTWKFSPTGQLSLCHINKTTLKDILDYDINDDNTLSDDNFESTDTIAYYCFNSLGQIRLDINENSSCKETFEYDQNGHLTKVSTYYWDNDVLSETLITLNDDGKPVRVEKRRNDGKSAGVVDAYCYDERGNRVAHQMNNGKAVQWMDYYEYDSLDNVIFKGRCHGYRGNHNSCECKGFRASRGYEYDDQHNMIRDYSIGDWKPSGWDNYYQYDSEGREIEYKHYDVKGKQRTFDRQVQTTYDSAGRMVKKEALLGEFRINESIFNYIMAVLEEWTYDEHGNLVEHVGYQTKNKPCMIVRYQYTYDPHGNWVKRVRYEGVNDDSMIATEVLERKIEYYE